MDTNTGITPIDPAKLRKFIVDDISGRDEISEFGKGQIGQLARVGRQFCGLSQADIRRVLDAT